MKINKNILLAIIMFSFSFIALAQKDKKEERVKVTGSSEIEFPSSKSLDDIKNEAREKAIVNALQKAFGEVVFSGSSVMVVNKTDGSNVETKTNFEMFGNTLVKGKCVEVLSQNYEEKKYEIRELGKIINVAMMYCNIEIYAEPISEPAYNIETYPVLKGERKTYDFNNMEELNLYFKAPVGGYVSVYYEDKAKNKVYRILPNETDKENYEKGQPVAADKPYIYFEDAGYVLYTEELKEFNRIYVFFSTESNPKPFLADINPSQCLSEQDMKKGYTLPIGLESKRFYDWLTKERMKNNNLQVDFIDITIKK